MANYYIPLVATPQIGEGGGGGGSDLPAVTAADNGDVLTVVNGAWDKAAPSGGGGVLVLTENYDPGTGTATLDHTWQEIHDAAESGKVIVVAAAGANSVNTLYFSVATNSEGYEVYFLMFTPQGSVVPVSYAAETANGYPVSQT